MIFLVRDEAIRWKGVDRMPVDRLHSLVAAGQFLAAYREAERLSIDPELNPGLKAKVFIAGVRAAAGLREIYSAAKMAEKAIEFAELGSDWEDIGNARLHSALVYILLGDTSQALRFFHLFFQHLDRYPTLQTKTAHAYYNKALAHQQRREFTEALESYKLSVEDFQKLGSNSGVVACLQNSAWVMLLQHKPHDAETFLTQAEALCQQIDVIEYQVTQLIIEALYARLTGEPDRATALCEEVFQPARPGVTDRHLAQASWIMAHLTLDAGRLHEAGIFADLAISHALQSKEPQLMNLASEVRQRVFLRKSELRA